jgi:hypothetical protein
MCMIVGKMKLWAQRIHINYGLRVFNKYISLYLQ